MPDAGVATFYPYLPDLAIAQVMFLAGLTVAVLGRPGPGRRAPAGGGCCARPRWSPRPGLLAAGPPSGWPGPARMDATRHDRHPGPARRGQRPAAAVHPGVQPHRHPGLPEPGLRQLPARHRGRAAAGAQPAGGPAGRACPDQPGRRRSTSRDPATGSPSAWLGPAISGTPPVYRLLLPDQLTGPALTPEELATQLRISDGRAIVASVIGDGPGASPAQHAVAVAIMQAAGVRQAATVPGRVTTRRGPQVRPGRSTARLGQSAGRRARPQVAWCSARAPGTIRVVRIAGAGARHAGLCRRAAVRRAAGRGPARLAGPAPGRAAGRADHTGAATMTTGRIRARPSQPGASRNQPSEQAGRSQPTSWATAGRRPRARP